jgi:hypothetical protein
LGLSIRVVCNFKSCLTAGLLALCLLAAAPRASAQKQDSSKITLDTSEVLFSTLAAINMCGYDQDFNSASPVRAKVRAEIGERLRASSAADLTREQMCNYYRDKQQGDPSRDLAQYISLALNVASAPDFVLAGKEADLPPDAANLVGFLPLLKKFYDAAGLNDIWRRHQPEYENLIAQLQVPVSQLILSTDLYLKMPISGYLGRKFVVYVEPMGASSQVNARNYGVDYALVASPGPNWLKTEQIRHTYLHFVLDPLVQKRANQLKRLDPLLMLTKTAPVEEHFKHDAGLMVIESLIRAIEARTFSPSGPPVSPKNLPALRSAEAQKSMEQGYILTQYFFDQLAAFEAEPTGLKDAFGDMMVKIDLEREKKRIAGITFAAKAAPEVVSASKGKAQLLDMAEERLAQRDPQGAHRIAQQALDQQTEDPARAMFILGRAAALNKDMDGARMLFERTLSVAKEPRMTAWSHIYLARILDLMCNRQTALSHYKAALSAGDPSPDTKSAADKGLRDLPPGCEKD